MNNPYRKAMIFSLSLDSPCFPAVFSFLTQRIRLQPIAKRHAASKPPPAREDAYRANNIGVALLEQFKHKEGAEAFQECAEDRSEAEFGAASISASRCSMCPICRRAARSANRRALAPEVPQPYYILGLIAKLQSRPDEALAAFQRVLKIDPNDVGTNINVGQIYSQQRKYPEAIAAFRLALAAEPYNATALYSLGQALMRAGQREEGLRRHRTLQAVTRARQRHHHRTKLSRTRSLRRSHRFDRRRTGVG